MPADTEPAARGKTRLSAKQVIARHLARAGYEKTSSTTPNYTPATELSGRFTTWCMRSCGFVGEVATVHTAVTVVVHISQRVHRLEAPPFQRENVGGRHVPLGSLAPHQTLENFHTNTPGPRKRSQRATSASNTRKAFGVRCFSR